MDSILRSLASFARSGGTPSFLRPPLPGVGVEISTGRVVVVRVSKERGTPRLAGYGVAPLPEGAVSAALLRCSVENPAELEKALRKAMADAGAKPGRAALTLPDSAGRVALITMPQLPRSQRQAEDLLRFRMKRSLPLRPEDIAISFTRLTLGVPEIGMASGTASTGGAGSGGRGNGGGAGSGAVSATAGVPGAPSGGPAGADSAGGPAPGQGDPGASTRTTAGSPGPAGMQSAATHGPARGGAPLLATMAMKPVIAQHESILAQVGLRVGLVSLATIELANLCRGDLDALAPRGGDAALLNCDIDYATLIIFRRGEPIFYRSRSYLEWEAADPGDRLRYLRRELSTSLSYYSEKLGGRLPLPVLLRNGDPHATGLELQLESVGLSPHHEVTLEGKILLPATGAEATGLRLAPALGIIAGRMR